MARRLAKALVAASVLTIALVCGTTRADAGLLQPIVGGGCGTMTSAFSSWGDGASYYFAPNGGFESGSTSWTLTGGASVKGGNESFYLNARNDSHSAYLPAGSTASTTVCGGTLYGSIRLFAVSADGTPARIHVRVVARSLLGILGVLDGGTFTAGSTWAPSPRVSSLCSALATTIGVKSLTLQFTADSGNARIDDLYVDPMLTKS